MGSYLFNEFAREQPCIAVLVLGNEVLVRATAKTRLTAGAPPADGVGCICCDGPTHVVQRRTMRVVCEHGRGQWCPLDISETENRPYSV